LVGSQFQASGTAHLATTLTLARLVQRLSVQPGARTSPSLSDATQAEERCTLDSIVSSRSLLPRPTHLGFHRSGKQIFAFQSRPGQRCTLQCNYNQRGREIRMFQSCIPAPHHNAAVYRHVKSIIKFQACSSACLTAPLIDKGRRPSMRVSSQQLGTSHGNTLVPLRIPPSSAVSSLLPGTLHGNV
jgi:hypothetical protein